jgi:hypothetical protein
MPDNERTKVCPLCAETIKAAAKVCPYCRKSQRRWVFMTRYDVLAVAVTLLFAIACYSFWNIYYQGRDFALDKDQIRVTDFHFVIEKNQYGTNVVMSGVLTNESDHSWNINHFQVRYLNSAGKVFDVDDNSEDVEFIVMPHSDHSFQLTLFDRTAAPQYSDCKVKVVSASDPRATLNIFGF